jgi:hypothetical protein
MFEDLFRDATRSIVVIGVNPLAPHLEQAARFFANLLTVNDALRVTILYESDSENFNQSLILDSPAAPSRTSFANLTLHRNRIAGEAPGTGFARDVLEQIDNAEIRQSASGRLFLRQVNLRLPVSMIHVDSRMWFSLTTTALGTVATYREVPPEDPLFRQLAEYEEFYLASNKGGVYLSKPGEELIQLFDKQAFPRGIFPRSSFYTTDFQRFSVWGFVFNRRGELLLQRRSMQTKDNRGLWDKSIGGHVDLQDSSSFITAQRELVEELFLPEAEFTKYVRADLGDIMNFGDWNPAKRPERSFKEAFGALARADWVQFRATDHDGTPLTLTRTSIRRYHEKDDVVVSRRTVFRSDVYLFVAPPSYIDTHEEMKKLVQLAEVQGAASDHRLISVDDLRIWIDQTERDGTAADTFTDDLLFINIEYRPMLERFAEFVKFVSRS